MGLMLLLATRGNDSSLETHDHFSGREVESDGRTFMLTFEWGFKKRYGTCRLLISW